MSKRFIDKVRERQKLGHSLRMQKLELTIKEALLKAAKDGCNEAEVFVKDKYIVDMRRVTAAFLQENPEFRGREYVGSKGNIFVFRWGIS